MKPIQNKLLISLLFLLLGLSPLSGRGQIFWLGFQAGEGVSWFSNPGKDSTLLSAGSGTSLGGFLRFGTRPYYQVAFEWLISTNQMKFQIVPGSSVHDNVPFHNFKLPVTAGYELIHKARFKWRVGGGLFIGTTVILSSNAFGFTQQDIRNPQFGVIGETGIQYMNFLVLVDYNYSLTKFFAKGVNEFGTDVRSHLQIFALKVGMQF
jgi:hypothetical protein